MTGKTSVGTGSLETALIPSSRTARTLAHGCRWKPAGQPDTAIGIRPSSRTLSYRISESGLHWRNPHEDASGDGGANRKRIEVVGDRRQVRYA